MLLVFWRMGKFKSTKLFSWFTIRSDKFVADICMQHTVQIEDEHQKLEINAREKFQSLSDYMLNLFFKMKV